ncbi:TPA: threonine synthase [Streptococcus equi subsp. zooepidemicus]|nr:threonine synthase [Streptococcus equi subsp. zooepidemicus]HEL0170477.1 threonine synthase [Streptococcus equi subsp. zooepidemicus]HEL0186554.1 threonine synthase [Streptococcus equi subsp. zooepidemicus]HEL0192471.1 threonine synthase [Streptococcus equi subsp. zooepidemicus]HEO8568576.1 threonine synthase [Streptococcus equi subsp. zooepidemicus]
MPMMYQSTRNAANKVTASQAILSGLADDGGLFTPTSMPVLDLDFEELKTKSYQEVAKLILSAFFDDYTEAELDACISSAYDDKFDTAVIAPLATLKDYHNLELFHGSTIAFKDMALSILPYLLTTAAKKQGVERKIAILTATSGDTGKAAMAGFADVPGTDIIVFYPKSGVSRIQELQMITQAGHNTHVVAIEGNFDDAQTEVKRLFNDPDLRERLAAQQIQLSSANSMNIGRLIPQVVYYIYAYAQLVRHQRLEAGETINIVVPTGNFGNLLAAYYAKEIGLPVAKFICASNENNVLTDFFASGRYDKKRPFKVTTSPSMDILVSSNLERLVFHLLGNDAQKTAVLMKSLAETGQYQLADVDQSILDLFAAGFATEQETAKEIKTIFESDHYVLDPHTAVASAVYRAYREQLGDSRPTIVASTASPYKFPRVVVEAISGQQVASDFEALEQLADISGVVVPQAVNGLQEAPIRHSLLVTVADMQQAVEAYLEV